MDWSLLTCARKGHLTYAPNGPGEQPLRDRLHTPTPVGTAWRCLRCGEYVIGEPQLTGPAARAPIVLRGRELKDALIMRFFAVERAVRGLVVLAACYAVWRVSGSEASIKAAFEDEIPLLRPAADRLGYDLDNSRVVAGIRQLLELGPATLRWFALGLLVYAAIELVEAVGLWTLQRWGEYFAVLATSIGLPIEIYELTERVTPLRLLAFAVNLALIAYIVTTKRLFGVRGGKAAHEAQRRSVSIMELEQAATSPALRGH